MNPFVAFDLDDTLYKEIDFVKSAHNHIAHILSKKYVQYHNDILSILDKNKSPFDLLCDFIKSIGGDEDVSWMLKEYRYHTPVLTLDPTVESCLIKLHNSNIPMGIITEDAFYPSLTKLRR